LVNYILWNVGFRVHLITPTRTSVEKELPSKKLDCSQFQAYLTDRQWQVFSLKVEYELRVTEIARRLRIDRKTVDEHYAAAQKKLAFAKSADKRARRRAKLGEY